jgi:protein phosphatase
VIPAKRAHLHVAAATHPGIGGRNNEDRFAVSAHHLEDNKSTASLLAVVADGVGGHSAGEIAAEIAVETISRIVAEGNPKKPLETLEKSIRKASEAIHVQSQLDMTQKGMGSTCVCAWIIGDRLYTASVGDSRIYLIRQGEIHQLTTDHTWVQEALDRGALTEEEARNHPRANIIRRFLGSEHPVVPDFRLRLSPKDDDHQAETNQGMLLHAGDRLLLCSDGLTDRVKDEGILAVSNSAGLRDSLDQLIETANHHGAHDNITLVGLEVPLKRQKSSSNRGTIPRERSFSWLKISVLAVSLVALIAIIAGVLWYSDQLLEQPTPSSSTAAQFLAGTQEETQATNGKKTALPSMNSTAVPTSEPKVTLVKATYTPWPTNTISP